MCERDTSRSVSLGLLGGGGSEACWCCEVEVWGCSSSDLVSGDSSFSYRFVIEGNCEVDPIEMACVEVEGESPSSCLAFAISL